MTVSFAEATAAARRIQAGLDIRAPGRAEWEQRANDYEDEGDVHQFQYAEGVVAGLMLASGLEDDFRLLAGFVLAGDTERPEAPATCGYCHEPWGGRGHVCDPAKDWRQKRVVDDRLRAALQEWLDADAEVWPADERFKLLPQRDQDRRNWRVASAKLAARAALAGGSP